MQLFRNKPRPPRLPPGGLCAYEFVFILLLHFAAVYYIIFVEGT